MTAQQLAQDLQNQIDLLDSDYNQMIGITEEEYLEKKQALEYQLEDVIDIIEEEYQIINDLIEE
jgi:hypothetical protein